MLTEYLSAVDQVIADLASVPHTSLTPIVRGALSCYPTLVVERLRALQLLERLATDPEQTDTCAPHPKPELHPLDYEWHFTDDSAEYITQTLMASRPTRVLCLGAPTVAQAIGRIGGSACLVDRNPLVFERLRQRGIDALVDFVRLDLLVEAPRQSGFPAVFLDPPWYADDIIFWLSRAAKASQEGAVIAFPLFRSLLRPEAQDERKVILAFASRFGSVEVLGGAVSYRTPLFEREALGRSGVSLTDPWKMADLVLVSQVADPGGPPPNTPRVEDRWETFVIGSQVIKLRHRTTAADSSPVVEPIAGCLDYILPTVSRRDPRRPDIDLWTSRNRVARVRNSPVVAGLLHKLEEGESLAAALGAVLPGGPVSRTEETLRALRVLLATNDME